MFVLDRYCRHVVVVVVVVNDCSDSMARRCSSREQVEESVEIWPSRSRRRRPSKDSSCGYVRTHHIRRIPADRRFLF